MCTWVCDQIFCEIEQPLDNWTSTSLDEIQNFFFSITRHVIKFCIETHKVSLSWQFCVETRKYLSNLSLL